MNFLMIVLVLLYSENVTMTYLTTQLSTEYELVVVLSFLYCIGLVVALVACVCGCRKRSAKNDFMGVDGMVKITNPDENVNHLPAVGKYSSDRCDDSVTESDDNSKRPGGGTNPHRSLPDIPIYTDGDRPGSDNGVSGDTSSDLYATVEDKFINSGGTIRGGMSNGVQSRASGCLRRSDNYARVRENPYDKVKKTENPYAKVETSEENEENSSGTPAAVVCCPEPVAPPRSRRSSLQNGFATTSDAALPSSTGDIPAATAVAGRIAASQDLPYMTPPINVPQQAVPATQQHFSGDSQDSSKGYTSISVREPLEHIRNQTKTTRTRKDEGDPHYATVSDDSDDNVYAAIVDPDGSETYAQIRPVTVVQVHERSSSRSRTDDPDAPAPELPNVNLKHVSHVHSRQASSSSCTSSVANVGSPKPEKRQANSPLPPTPAVSPDVYARVDKTHARQDSKGSINVVRNLEDMYAKVYKNKKKHEEDDDDTGNASMTDHRRSYTPDVAVLTHHKVTDSHARQSWSSRDSFDENKYDCGSDSDVALETRNNGGIADHCYETLNKSGKNDDQDDTGYEKIRDAGPESISSNDPGYERLNHSRISSDTDPNYEVLRPHRTSSSSSSGIGYSTVKTHDESAATDDGYSVVDEIERKKKNSTYERLECGDEEDPNYESVRQKSTESESDPNYESVKYLDVAVSEPPYERLRDDENKDSDPSECERVSAALSYQRMTEHGSKSSENSDDRTVSDNGKFPSNGTDEEDGKPSKSDVKSSSARSSVDVDVNLVGVEEIIVNDDEHMYFQV